MTPPDAYESLLHIMRDSVLLALTVAAPMVLAAVGAGLLVAVAQALTQIREPTLAFVPKVAAVALTLSLATTWVGRQILVWTLWLFELIPDIARP